MFDTMRGRQRRRPGRAADRRRPAARDLRLRPQRALSRCAAGAATVLINPTDHAAVRREEEGWEGCLSVPGLRGVVPRFARIRYTGFDPEGQPIEREADGFHARVVQHECDHLIGRLYPTRMRDLTQLGFTSVLFPGPGRQRRRLTDWPAFAHRDGCATSGTAVKARRRRYPLVSACAGRREDRRLR